MAIHPWYAWHDDALHLHIQVQTRACRNEIVGPLGDRLTVRLTSPPLKGRANAQLIRLLAKLYNFVTLPLTLLHQ